MDTIHERRSGVPRKTVRVAIMDTGRVLPSLEDIRRVLAGKQYFDNDYSPSDFLSCQCKRHDCPRCQPTSSSSRDVAK